MGCDDPREKLENKIMEMNIDKIEIQMEKIEIIRSRTKHLSNKIFGK